MMTVGVIVGNRGFFPDHLARSGREEMIRVLEAAGVKPIVLGAEDIEARRRGDSSGGHQVRRAFQKHRNEIDGVIVTLPNFGDERAIADTLRMADLHVPVLVQATPDSPGIMSIRDRRDSFCGKMSACNNLTQYGIPYSLTHAHTEALDSEFFRKDLEWFLGVCRVVKGLRRSPCGRGWRAAGGFQYGSLQREDSGGERDFHRAYGFVGDLWPHQQDER